ncbi:hypothetical protein [Methanothrix sp.]|uniref:hypothetical protein n=1 Tax=Methanothrix sp. TaxID=90426 RepID=UPI002581199D|nr:hypothetical protein [Methanothrix sp.]
MKSWSGKVDEYSRARAATALSAMMQERMTGGRMWRRRCKGRWRSSSGAVRDEACHLCESRLPPCGFGIGKYISPSAKRVSLFSNDLDR